MKVQQIKREQPVFITVLKLISDLFLPKPEFGISGLQEWEIFHNNEETE